MNFFLEGLNSYKIFISIIKIYSSSLVISIHIIANTPSINPPIKPLKVKDIVNPTNPENIIHINFSPIFINLINDKKFYSIP